MNTRAVALSVVAFALGALAAGSIGVRVIEEVRTTEDATSLPPSAISSTTTAPPQTYQVAENETLIASTALVPASLQVSGSGLALEYGLVTLSPHEGVPPIRFFGGFGVETVIPNEDLDHVYPRSWVLTTTGGESIEGGPANSGTRVARFDVGDGFSLSEVESVEVTEALAPFPVQQVFTLSESEPEEQVVDGVTVKLLNISEQGETTIVQVELEIDEPEDFHAFVAGEGPGWRSAVFEAEGRPRVTLTWVGGDLPDEIPLRLLGSIWVSVVGEFDVSLEGL